MIIDTETKRKLREMNATDLLDAFERLDEQTTMPLSHAEVIRLRRQRALRSHGRQDPTPVKRAGLRYPQADLRTIDLMEERGLDRSVIAGLDAGNYLGQRLNVVFQGATGSGKSHLLCALAKSACRGRYRAIYVRMPDLAEQVTAAAGKPGGVPKLVRKYSPTTCSPSTNGSSTSPTNHSNDSCSSSWNSGTTRPAPRSPPNWRPRNGTASWRRHHRRRDPRPHRAQHDLDQYRRIQHETTPRTNHARQLTQKAGGPPTSPPPASPHHNPGLQTQ